MALHTSIVNVTPATARAWLKKNTLNRNLRDETVSKYARDMKEGNWETTHQGIGFYDDGTLADGQHRLHAVVRADVPVKFVVTHGIPRNAGQVIDQNAPRLTHDAIRIGGGPGWIDRDIVAMVRFILNGMGDDSKPRSVPEIVDYAARYEQNLQYAQALALVKKRNLTSSGIVASYFCALEAGVPYEIIKRFAEIMHKGEINGASENAAIRLREYLISEGGRAWIGQERVHTTKKVQRAIQLFAEGKPTAKLYTPETLVYPIPQ
jgi:hypothetical protein